MAATVLWILLILNLIQMHCNFILTDNDLSVGCPIHLPRDKSLKIYGRFCYQFILNEECFYWHQARHDCQNRGGDLLVVDSSDIQHFILSYLRRLHFRGDGIWLGLEENGRTHQWTWINGERVQYSNWGSADTGDDYYLECAHMNISSGKWHTIPCQMAVFNMAYVCQYKFQPDPFATRPSTTNSPTLPTTTLPTTTTPLTIRTTAVTTPPPTTLTSTKTTVTSTSRRPSPGTDFRCEFTCQLDCGILGFKVDTNGCPLCECVR